MKYLLLASLALACASCAGKGQVSSVLPPIDYSLEWDAQEVDYTK
jgi:hypothetical protein